MSFVLLLRPNDFIVDSMASLLTRVGVSPFRVGSIKEIDEMPPREVVGAVISTAVTSVVHLAFAEALSVARHRSRAIPLVVSTMVRDLGQAAESVRRETRFVDPTLEVILPTAAGLTSKHLGTPSGVLLLRKEDIETAVDTVVELLRRHFGLRS